MDAFLFPPPLASPPPFATPPSPPNTTVPVEPVTLAPILSPEPSTSPIILIVGVVISAIAVLLIVCTVAYCCLRRRSAASLPPSEDHFEVYEKPQVMHKQQSSHSKYIYLPVEPKDHVNPYRRNDSNMSENSRPVPAVWNPRSARGSDASKTMDSVSSAGWAGGLKVNPAQSESSESQMSLSVASSGSAALRTFPGRALQSSDMSNLMRTYCVPGPGGQTTIASGWDSDWTAEDLCEQVQLMATQQIWFAGKCVPL